jgi:hypothetical protein
MANEQNLIHFSERTPEERKEIATRGGLKSGEARRARRTLREELLALLQQGDIQEKITLALVKKAENGDIKAYEVLRDTIGEKPIERLDSNVNISNPLNGLTEEELKKLAGE